MEGRSQTGTGAEYVGPPVELPVALCDLYRDVGSVKGVARRAVAVDKTHDAHGKADGEREREYENDLCRCCLRGGERDIEALDAEPALLPRLRCCRSRESARRGFCVLLESPSFLTSPPPPLLPDLGREGDGDLDLGVILRRFRCRSSSELLS